MTRAALLAFLMMIAPGGPASAQIAQVEAERPSLTVLPEPSVALAAQTTQTTITAISPRRRGSMVGYIDDAVVSSKVRVRFETGMHTLVPDRAEFFYAKCGCYRDLPASHPAYDPEAAGPGPGIVSDLNFQQFYMLAEYAAGNRFSVFGELPVRWLQPQSADTFGDQTGLSDLRAGVKFGLAASEDLAVTAQVKTFLQTGDSRSGLGTNHASIEPGLLFHGYLSPRAAIAGQFSWWIPFGGSDGVPTTVEDKFAGNIISYGIGPSVDVYRRGDVSLTPVVELVGWHVLSGFQTTDPGDASGTNIVNLKLGARASFGGSSIYGGYGFAMTDAAWYEDIFRFEYRFSF